MEIVEQVSWWAVGWGQGAVGGALGLHHGLQALGASPDTEELVVDIQLCSWSVAMAVAMVVAGAQGFGGPGEESGFWGGQWKPQGLVAWPCLRSQAGRLPVWQWVGRKQWRVRGFNLVVVLLL